MLLSDVSFLDPTVNAAYQTAIENLYQQSLTARGNFLFTELKVSLPVTLPADHPSIPLSYDPVSHTVSFIGVMTPGEQTALKGIASNSAPVIDELFQRPRMLVKFYEPIFTAPLNELPPAIDFKAQL